MGQSLYDTQPLKPIAKRSETALNLKDLKRFIETYHMAVMYKAFDELSLDEQSTLEMHLHDVLVYVNEKLTAVVK